MKFVKIKDLEADDKGFNIKVKILKKKSERVVTIKKTQQQNRVADFLVGDDTGIINLTVWGVDIDNISIGNTIEIQKAYIRSFNNELFLNIGKYSKWSVCDTNCLDDIEIPTEKIVKQKQPKKSIKICNLLDTKKGINLDKVKVIEINNIRSVKVKKDGSEHEVADAILGDETGIIKCSFWDDDIKKIKESMVLRIHNAYIST
ncbi:MAG: hypothetical protein ACTSO9_08035, partial [Candidatus Helarchaeota archaeon]